MSQKASARGECRSPAHQSQLYCCKTPATLLLSPARQIDPSPAERNDARPFSEGARDVGRADVARSVLTNVRAGDEPYAWWQAGPWAGKSALLSWFVLHPPLGVDVVSFFITARLSDESDAMGGRTRFHSRRRRGLILDLIIGTVNTSQTLSAIGSSGDEAIIELGPGTVLAGLLQRTRKEANVMSISDAESAHRLAPAR